MGGGAKRPTRRAAKRGNVPLALDPGSASVREMGEVGEVGEVGEDANEYARDLPLPLGSDMVGDVGARLEPRVRRLPRARQAADE